MEPNSEDVARELALIAAVFQMDPRNKATLQQGAAEITRLRAEVERLREDNKKLDRAFLSIDAENDALRRERIKLAFDKLDEMIATAREEGFRAGRLAGIEDAAKKYVMEYGQRQPPSTDA